MHKKKISELIATGVLLICVMLGTLAGCGTEDAGTGETENAPVSETAEVKEAVITNGNKALYRIVREDLANETEIELAVELRRGLEEATGINFQFGTDWVKVNEEPDNTSYEILVGMTNRDASIKFAENLNALQYGIAIDGNKIVILGNNAMSLEYAVDRFLKTDILSLNDEGNYVVRCASTIETMKLEDGQLPPFDAEKLEFYKPNEVVDMMKAYDTTVDQYQGYLKLLEECGFKKYTDNVIGKNLFATYTSDSLTVNAYYIDSNKITRVVWEPKGDLPILKEENVYEEKVDTLLTSVDLEIVMFYEGMSYVIRLCDGSFIIIDGGVSDYDGVEAKKMLDILKSQTPEGEKPVIAAWMFTHCHGDHLGLFPDFAVRYHDEIVVESFYYNFPPEEEIAHSDSPYMIDDSHFRYTAFKKSLEEYYPDTPKIRPHTGNVFYIRNATFEILGTHEDIYPRDITTNGMNASTIMYRMEVGGQTTMWLGDAAEITGDVALEQFGDYLKSDIMQIAHHGGVGGTVRLYEVIDPEYALYPVPAEAYQTSYEPTDWICNKSENVKLVIVSGFGTSTIKLPFAVTEGKYNKLPPYVRRGGMPTTFD